MWVRSNCKVGSAPSRKGSAASAASSSSFGRVRPNFVRVDAIWEVLRSPATLCEMAASSAPLPTLPCKTLSSIRGCACAAYVFRVMLTVGTSAPTPRPRGHTNAPPRGHRSCGHDPRRIGSGPPLPQSGGRAGSGARWRLRGSAGECRRSEGLAHGAKRAGGWGHD